MIDAPRVLRPVSEAGDAIDKLVTYERPAELAEALGATWTAVDRSLRLLLRSHPGVAEAERLTAMAPDEMPLPRLVEALRQRSLISMELAGRVHELAQAAERAAQGDVRASDADVGRVTVSELRREVNAAADSPIQEAAHHAVATGAVEEPAQPVAPPSRRPPLLLGLLALIVLGAIAFALYLLLRPNLDKQGEGAFKEQRYGVAEQKFRGAVDRNPKDVLALLYLSRIYRRQGRLAAADTVLGQAMRYSPDDADVRRERGHLLMAAGQPARAAVEYQAAVRAQPGDRVNWMALVQALRATNDPRAESVILSAPPDMQPALRAAPPPVAPQPGPPLPYP